MPSNPKVYLEYLDKEMTIMGILSTFCVVVVGVTLDKTAGAKSGEAVYLGNVWKLGKMFVLAGASSTLLAALFFYRQRSLLAFYHGQIALNLATTPPDLREINECLAEADAWETWDRYRAAFCALGVGMANFGFAICCPTSSLGPKLLTYRGEIVALGAGIGLFVAIANVAVYRLFWDEEEPWKTAWFHLTGF